MVKKASLNTEAITGIFGPIYLGKAFFKHIFIRIFS